jgi:hypothetical protein
MVTANGDNADYSIVLKNYHGIRVHINQGNNEFKETFFYPVYGATRLLAEDFDQDGDIDFAIRAGCVDIHRPNVFLFDKPRNDPDHIPITHKSRQIDVVHSAQRLFWHGRARAKQNECAEGKDKFH